MRAVVAVLLFVAAAHAGLWGFFQEKQQAPDFRGILPSVSYTPFEPGHTVADPAADSEKIRDDLRKFSTITRAVRLYTATEGSELVPPIAAEFGVKVMVGTWISRDTNRNDREIDAAIDLARRNSNVIGVIVGNETIYRGEQIPIDNLVPVSEREADSEEFKRILAEEAQRTGDAETQPEDKRSLAVKWAND
jgi:exo-beta-1,3-glucanase (GH17 family)